MNNAAKRLGNGPGVLSFAAWRPNGTDSSHGSAMPHRRREGIFVGRDFPKYLRDLFG